MEVVAQNIEIGSKEIVIELAELVNHLSLSNNLLVIEELCNPIYKIYHFLDNLLMSGELKLEHTAVYALTNIAATNVEYCAKVKQTTLLAYI